MMQRHALEPVMFSLTILSRDVQQNCEKAWRHLGFVPDLDKIVGADESTTSDPYHRGRIFEELIELQQTGMNVFLSDRRLRREKTCIFSDIDFRWRW
jgi:hypothetical protein